MDTPTPRHNGPLSRQAARSDEHARSRLAFLRSKQGRARGRSDADLTLFVPATVVDRATFKDPTARADVKAKHMDFLRALGF